MLWFTNLFFICVYSSVVSTLKCSTLSVLSFILLQEGGPLPGPESGLLPNTWKWIVRGDTRADKARDFIGKRRPGGEQENKGAPENYSATWLTVSGVMVMGLVSGLSLAKHSDSGSFPVAHASFSQDQFQWEGFWEDMWTGVSCPLLTFPEFFRLVVACSVFLSRISCLR